MTKSTGVAARYCLVELVAVFCVIFAVLMLISLGSRFTGYLQDAAAGDLAADALWLMVALRLPDFVQLVTPFSLFLAVLLLIGRLDADAEMPILQMANVGPLQLSIWLMWVVIPLTLLVAFLSFVLTPASRDQFLNLLSSQEVISEFDVIKPQAFRTFDDGLRVSYMGGVNREERSVREIFLHQETSNLDVTILAKDGSYHIDPNTGKRYFELNDGRRYTTNFEDGSNSVASFESLTQRVETGDIQIRMDDTTRIATMELDLMEPAQRMEWHWRMAMPLMTLISALCAVGLGRVKPRSGRFGKILPGLMFFIAYYGLVLVLMNELQSSVTLSQIGLWPVHGLMLSLAIYLIHRNWRPI